MAALNFIDAQKQPGRTGPPSEEVYQLWIENPEGLRLVTYGDRQPSQVLPHDHGSRRGLNLEACLMQSSLGPQAVSGSPVGSWLAGVPLYPSSTPEIDFRETPKMVWSGRIDIPGGVTSGYLEVVFEYSGGPGTLILGAQLLSLEQAGTELGEAGSAPALTQTLAGAARPSRNSFAFTNLEDLGPASVDRTVLAEIWLSADPDANNWRLCAVAWVNGDPDVGNTLGEPLEFKPPRVGLDVASLQTGMVAQSAIAQQAHQVWNQLGFEVLGGAPGLNADLTPNRAAPWRRVISRRHRHTGRSFIDPETGLLSSDGAVPNLPLSEAVFVDDLDDTATELVGANPFKGLKLHPAGTLSIGSGWLNIEHRQEAPIGLPQFLMQARISFATVNQIARLWWYLELRDLGGTLLDVEWVSQGIAVDTSKSGTMIRSLVEPLNANAWQQNEIRLGNGLGLWTTKAARNPLPSEIRTIANLPRTTKVMRIKYVPTMTGPIRLIHAWALEVAEEGSGVYDAGARLVGLKVWPAPGY